MPLKALSLDFWDTIFKMENEFDPKILRLEKMKSLLSYFKVDLDDADLSSLYSEVWNKFDKEWFENYYTMTTAEIIEYVLKKLNVSVPNEVFENLVITFQEALLKSPPILMENVKIEIEKLAKKYKLAIISDTGFTPGRVLKMILQSNSMLHHFDVLLFSDEFGRSKPHPDTFLHVSRKLGVKPQEMVHIGDNERTDVGGAISVGIKAILFTKGKNGIGTETKANAIMKNWADVWSLIKTL
jgi:putative hydrolase of the HAD superfamily